jgi:NDP-sugar pyrophosphorylase family protein
MVPSYFFDLSSYPFLELFSDVQYPWEVLAKIGPYLKQQRLGQIEGTISPQAYLVNPELISIGLGTIVEPGAYIQGPCIIGQNCLIRHGAYIRGQVITGDRCVIGHASELKNIVFLNDVHAAHFAYVGDSILGNHVNLGAGTRCANLKLDRTSIVVHYQGRKIETGIKKFGAILGDHSQTGCNAVTNPGTLMGVGVFCYPCVNIGGFIPSRSIIKMEAKPIVISY